MQAQPDNPINDLNRTQIALHRLYMASIAAAARAEAAEREDELKDEDTLGGNLSAASSEEKTSYGNPSPTV